ncbi:phosphoglycerate mutase family protein [Streptococcus varani]|uniref:Phosphoglycerate mutase family protein n=1 Tax=Streptococcus varani TaxID=1608583 RepID=A0A0E4CTG3_9STRE|nr:histidine phosphatase family protein [Streptococcus varani]CQR25717.1 phosphoglycerate mutase family protein [Streptococcus varani]
MKLILMRHGETDWNVERRIQGSQDIALNHNGIGQAEDVVERLMKDFRITKIYSSDLVRAVQTAETINLQLNVQIIKTSKLREINFGEWEGKTWTEVSKEYGTEFTEWKLNRRYAVPPNGESYQSLLERTIEVLAEITGTEEGTSEVLIVTHGANIMVLKSALNGTDFSKMTKYKEGNASFTVFDDKDIEDMISLLTV